MIISGKAVIMDDQQGAALGEPKKLGVVALIGLVVSACIGAGIFNLPGQLAEVSAAGPMIWSWVICLVGVVALVLTLNNLLRKRPDLDAGIFSYGKAGCGWLGGFISGWGYWLSSWIGNVAFATLLMAIVGSFWPVFGDGSNWPSVIVAAIVLWCLTFIVMAGMKGATLINTIGTICKLIPIVIAMIVLVCTVKAGVFTQDFWGNLAANVSHGVAPSGVWTQMQGSIVNIMFVFVGIEGAAVLSKRAKSNKAAGNATLWGLLILAIVYVWCSILPYAVFPQGVISNWANNGTDGTVLSAVMSNTVGAWAYWILTIGIIISILACWLSWTILPAETTALMSNSEMTLAPFWGKPGKKRKDSYVTSLLIATILQTIFILCLPFLSAAYTFASQMCTVAVLITYMFAGIYQMVISVQRKEAWQFIVGVICTAFEVFAVFVAGWQDLLLLCIGITVGFFFYVPAAKKNGHRVGPWEWIVMALVCCAGIISIILACVGIISV